MKKLLIILLCFPMIFSCGDKDNLQREITNEMCEDGYTGKGTMHYVEFKYVGEFKDGKLHGQGTFTWYNGDKYVGEFKDDMRNGQGTFTGSFSGSQYVGEWKDNKKHGQGTYTNGLDGAKHVGQWKDNKKDGQGTVFFTDGSVYKGLWENGVETGNRVIMKNGIWK